MTTVYLVRHAEAEGNLFKRIHGQYDSPVTALGRRQIECLEKRFASVSVDAVYASDLKRTCRQAAKCIYVPQAGITQHTKLREIYLGAWEDKPFGEVMRTDLEDMLLLQHPASRIGALPAGSPCGKWATGLSRRSAASSGRIPAVLWRWSAIAQRFGRCSVACFTGPSSRISICRRV